MNIANILAGTILLFLGRRLFWLFVGCIGFSFAYNYAQIFLTGQPVHLIMAIAILAGIVGALLAVFFQKVMVAISGFLSGIYITLFLLEHAGFAENQLILLIGIGGGILGSILLIFLFDWALILLSSLAGTTIILQSGILNSLTHDPRMISFTYLFLLILGCAVQTKFLNPQTGKGRSKL